MNLGLGLNIATTKSGGGLLTPFDTATPTAGYSLRYLSINYFGQPVVRVRKDVVGNPEQDFTPSQLTDGTLATFADGNDCFVSIWYDQFGSNDATNSTAAEQPKIWDSTTGLLTEGGRPAIEFDGSDDYLQASSLNISQPTMYFIVAKRDALTGKQNYIDGATDRQEVAIDSFNDTYDMFAGAGAATSVVATTNQEVLVALFNGASSELFVNAVEIALSATPGTNAINNLLVGADTDQSDFLDGTMQEIIIYDADQSDRVLLQDNINTYFILYGLKHYRQRVLADSGTFALQGRDALVYNSVTIPEMPSLICSCDAYKATKLYNINPA